MNKSRIYNDTTVRPDDNGIRPAGKPDECFYCNVKVGGTHKPDCVIIVKEIELKATFEDGESGLFRTTVPHFWSEEDIAFRFNESTWCANNLCSYEGSAELATKKADAFGELRCLCGHVEVTFVRVIDGPYIEERPQ